MECHPGKACVSPAPQSAKSATPANYRQGCLSVITVRIILNNLPVSKDGRIKPTRKLAFTIWSAMGRSTSSPDFATFR
jgi:hypothetical protein